MINNTSVGISIITSIYNKSKYLNDYVESIKNQNFTDYEIICVDDASTDDSLEHLMNLVSDDTRFTIIKNEENCGPSISRNKAIKMSKGKYICFLDADDCIKPNALELLWDLVEKNELEGVFFSASEYTNDLKKELRTIQYKETYSICDGRTLISLLHKNNEYQSACGFQLWKSEYLCGINAEFYPGIVYEDTLFTLQVLLKAKRVMAISDILYIYRKCENSITHSLGIEQLKSCLIVYDILTKIEQQYANDKLVHSEIIKRLSLFKKRIQHIVCIEQDKNIYLNNYEGYYDVLNPFLKKENYPYIRELSYEEICKIKETSKIYIFGDGLIAEETIIMLKKYHININGIIVSYSCENMTWQGYKIIHIEDFHEDGLVIISVTEKWRKLIETILYERGNDTIYIAR